MKKILGFLSKSIASVSRLTRDSAVVRGVGELADDRRDVGEIRHLDIGSSDGRIARRLSERQGSKVIGVDVELQVNPEIEVVKYDGGKLPFDSNTFDLVSFIDVIHHIDDQESALREAARVLAPGGVILIKDHLRSSKWSNFVLGVMDQSSNLHAHAALKGKYLSIEEWFELFGRAHLSAVAFKTPFQVHPIPLRLVARNSYHFVARLEKNLISANTGLTN